MNKQRKVLITITYNEMGIIIDTKAEEVAQPDLQPTCNQLATDCISRQAAIDGADKIIERDTSGNNDVVKAMAAWKEWIKGLPPAQPETIYCKDCKYWMPYDWMFSEIWRSRNMDDYSEKEIGCQYCDMSMKADDFCSRAERRTDG